MQIDSKPVGERIRDRRKALKWSQAELGDALGLGQSAVSNWENGVGVPSVDNVLKVSELLRVTPDYLLLGGSPTTLDLDQEALTVAIDCLESKLGSRYHSLSPRAKARLLSYIYSKGSLPKKELAALLALVA